MPLLIGIRDDPREWRRNVSLGLKMLVGAVGRMAEDRVGRNVSDVKRSDWRTVGETSNGCPRGKREYVAWHVSL